MLGRTFSHYRVTGKLGEGGMGVVYLAEDTLLGREVAIKFPSAEGDGTANLLREARSASALTHPNIAAVFDCGEYEGRPYIVMERVRGQALDEVLTGGPLEPGRAVEIVSRIAEAVAEAHHHGVVHRDIKPSNVMLGERGEVKVLDFGLARRSAPMAVAAAAQNTATVDVLVSGTPAYMAPEQVRGGAADQRSDIFSLGATLYECLTGRRVFQAATPIETLARVLQHDPPPPSTVNPAAPRRLDFVVARAMAKDPADRYQTAAALLEDLRGSAVDPRPAAHRRWARGRWAIPAAGLAVVAMVAAWLLWPQQSRPPRPEAKRFYDEGVNALADGTWRKAAQALERAVQLDSGFTLAQAHLAEAWNELDYSDRARRAMLAAVPPGAAPANVDGADLLHIRAIHAVLTGNFPDAAARYRELSSRVAEEARPRVLLDLGRALEKSEDLQAALTVYLDVARRYPQYPAALLRAGVVRRRTGQRSEAEAALQQAEQQYRSLSNAEGQMEALYQRSILANQAGRLTEARAMLEQILAMARTSGNEHQRITALLQLNSVAYRQGQADEARRYALEALELARLNGLDDLTARSLLELGTGAQLRGEADEARQCFTKALATAQSFGGRRTEARARFSLASVRVDLGEVEAAVEDLEHALKFYRGAGYRTETSRCALLQARARRTLGQYEAARQTAEAELASARHAGDPVQEHLALDLLGGIMQDQERYTEALALFEQMHQASAAKGDLVGARWAAASCAGALWRLGRYTEAERQLALAAGMGQAAQDQGLLAVIELTRAEAALSQGHWSQAAARAQDARRMSPGNRETLAGADRVAALAAVRSGRGQGAPGAAAPALDLARATGNARMVLQAQLALAEAQLEAGDTAAALRTAGEALASAQRGGQRESAWRAATLAALAASRQRGNAAGAARTREADSALAGLEQALQADGFRTFSQRPDVRRLRERTAGTLAGRL